MKKDRTILFDFDGVIIDSFPMAFETSKMFLKKRVTEDDFRKFFENGLIRSSFSLGPRIIIMPFFFRVFSSKILKQPAFPRIKENLEKLASDNNLIIISSCPSNIIKNWLSFHNISHYFYKILGMDIHISKVQKIKAIFKKYKLNSESCVFVTDTLGDIRAGNKAGIKSLAVSYGFHNEETLMKGNPAGVIHNPDEMVVKINDFFNSQEGKM